MNRQLKFIRQLKKVSTLRENKQQKRIVRKEEHFFKIITINILRQIREEFASIKEKPRCYKKYNQKTFKH